MSYRHLTRTERDVMFRMMVQGKSNGEIAASLGRHPSTISRQRRRNANCDGRYWPDVAHAKARIRARGHIHRPKTGHQLLMGYVARRLERRWSPEQIAGRLRAVGSAGLLGMTISRQTIYRWIWSDRQRVAKFRPFLRVAWRKRRKPYGKPSRRGQIPGRVSIDQRPQAVEARSRLGDWEGDTLVGKGHRGSIATCVDRASRYLVARRMPKATAEMVNGSLHGALRRLPAPKRQTLTVDNGKESARHAELGRRLGLDVYFAHPYHAWERGTCENTSRRGTPYEWHCRM
jgi:IS30 family transposase